MTSENQPSLSSVTRAGLNRQVEALGEVNNRYRIFPFERWQHKSRYFTDDFVSIYRRSGLLYPLQTSDYTCFSIKMYRPVMTLQSYCLLP
jgi:hypothetical protein